VQGSGYYHHPAEKVGAASIPSGKVWFTRRTTFFSPIAGRVGGILIMHKVAAMCEAFHKPCIGHGAYGLLLAGRIQAHAAWGARRSRNSRWPRRPLLPQEQWAPASKILHGKELYTFRNGELLIPQGPGLGLDLDEEAIEH